MSCSRFNQDDSIAGRADYVDTGACALHPGCHCDPASPFPIASKSRPPRLAEVRALDTRLLLSSGAVQAQKRPGLIVRTLRALGLK